MGEDITLLQKTLSLRGQPYQPFNHRATLLNEDITLLQKTLSLRGPPYQPFNHRATLLGEDITLLHKTLSLSEVNHINHSTIELLY